MCSTRSIIYLCTNSLLLLRNLFSTMTTFEGKLDETKCFVPSWKYWTFVFGRLLPVCDSFVCLYGTKQICFVKAQKSLCVFRSVLPYRMLYSAKQKVSPGHTQHTARPLSVCSPKTSSKTDTNAIAKFSMSWSQQAPFISKHMLLRMYPTRFIIHVWFELLPLLRILMSTMRSFGKRPRTTHREKTLFRQAGADRNAKCSIRWCRRAMHIN